MAISFGEQRRSLLEAGENGAGDSAIPKLRLPSGRAAAFVSASEITCLAPGHYVGRHSQERMVGLRPTKTLTQRRQELNMCVSKDALLRTADECASAWRSASAVNTRAAAVSIPNSGSSFPIRVRGRQLPIGRIRRQSDDGDCGEEGRFPEAARAQRRSCTKFGAVDP